VILAAAGLRRLGLEARITALLSLEESLPAVGQGAIVDRANERLGASDAGVALVRRIFLREVKQMRDGRSPKQWRPLERAEELPVPGAVAVGG